MKKWNNFWNGLETFFYCYVARDEMSNESDSIRWYRCITVILYFSTVTKCKTKADF